MEEEVQKAEIESEDPSTEGICHDRSADDNPQEGQVSDRTEEKGSDKPDDQADPAVIDKPADETPSDNPEIKEQEKSSDQDLAATEPGSTDKSEDNGKEALTKDASNGEAEDEDKDMNQIEEIEQDSAKISARDPTPECTMKDPQDDTLNNSGVTNVQEDGKPGTEEETSPEMKPKEESASESNQSQGPSPDVHKTGHSQLSHVTLDSELLSPPPHNISVVNRTAHPTRNSINNAMTLNKMAIAASAQNKLPVSRLKGILERVGRHTESSAKKRGSWYKSETSYVDVNSYSWKNLSLYKDYQQHMWKGDGTVKSSCRK